jgi:hypothetical protein
VTCARLRRLVGTGVAAGPAVNYLQGIFQLLFLLFDLFLSLLLLRLSSDGR